MISIQRPRNDVSDIGAFRRFLLLGQPNNALHLRLTNRGEHRISLLLLLFLHCAHSRAMATLISVLQRHKPRWLKLIKISLGINFDKRETMIKSRAGYCPKVNTTIYSNLGLLNCHTQILVSCQHKGFSGRRT